MQRPGICSIPFVETPWLTAPNLLTLSRIPLAALVWLRPADPLFVLFLMALAGLTDVLDGWLERRRRGGIPAPAPTIGMWLDPLCDKVFVVSTLVAVGVAVRPPLHVLPLMATREILQVAALLILGLGLRRRFRFQAAVLGKIATVCQFATLAAVLARHPAQTPFALLTAAVGLAAVVHYVSQARPAKRQTV
jgi:phosphatidylglycerophosphate synthase